MYPPVEASRFLAIPNFVAIPGAPIFGLLIDRFGRSLIWMIISCAMQVVGQLVFLGLADEWFLIEPTWIMLWIGRYNMM